MARSTVRVAYDKEMGKFRKASQKFRLVQESYRARKIDDAQFLKGKAAFDKASKAVDAAERALMKAMHK